MSLEAQRRCFRPARLPPSLHRPHVWKHSLFVWFSIFPFIPSSSSSTRRRRWVPPDTFRWSLFALFWRWSAPGVWSLGGILIEESWSGKTERGQSGAARWRQKGAFREEARWRSKLKQRKVRYQQQWNQRENKKETKEKCLSTFYYIQT